MSNLVDMYSISLRSYINIKPRNLLKIWRKPEVLLKYATNIKRLKVIKREKEKVITSWEVEVDKVKLRWRQLDVLDFKNRIVFFTMQSGEFKKYFGNWRVSPTKKEKTALQLDVDIDWGIPVLEPYVKNALERRSRLLFKGFLKSIKKVAEDYAR